MDGRKSRGGKSQRRIFFSARLFDCATLSGSWSGVTLTASADQVPGHLGLYGGGLKIHSWVLPQGRRGRRDAGDGVPGCCSSRVLRGGMSPSRAACEAGS